MSIPPCLVPLCPKPLSLLFLFNIYSYTFCFLLTKLFEIPFECKTALLPIGPLFNGLHGFLPGFYDPTPGPEHVFEKSEASLVRPFSFFFSASGYIWNMRSSSDCPFSIAVFAFAAFTALLTDPYFTHLINLIISTNVGVLMIFGIFGILGDFWDFRDFL